MSDSLFYSLLTKDPLDNYEDSEKYTKYWLPKVEQYRLNLANSTPQKLLIELPQSLDILTNNQFNAVDYLYSQKLLSEKEFEITDTPGTLLVKKMASKEYTAVEVFKAFAKRAIIAHQFTNCAVDIFIEEGLKQAQERDEYLQKNDKLVGPLHGIPITLKEHICIRGKIAHGGYVAMIDNILEKDAITTQILSQLGAVFYMRTNEPQALLHLDSGNNITGFTKNPYNLLLSSGGSSSGEGAVVSFGGSVLGVGSDIGGSIRSPAAFSGCHGLRPSTRRISARGIAGGADGQESVPSVIGPLARSIDDLELWMKSYINDGKPWNFDPWCLPIPWRDMSPPKINQLTIAVVRDDGVVRVSPPIRRALDIVVEKLQNEGAKIIELTTTTHPLTNSKLAYDCATKLSNADGNHLMCQLFSQSGEPLKKLTKWYLNLGDGAKHYTVAENRELNRLRDTLREEYSDFMVENKVDVILGPAYNNVAPHREKVYNESYTLIYNLLDFPALVFQTGLFQDPEIDRWNESDLQYEYRSGMEELENNSYKPDECCGAPIALQIAGRRYFDEEVVATGKSIVEFLGVDLLKR